MIGKDSSPQSLGVVPCAISWLFRLIDERKERTGTRFSVRVSAVEVCGPDQSLRDLLAEVAAGSLQDAQSPGMYLREDPVCGAQVHPCWLWATGGSWPLLALRAVRWGLAVMCAHARAVQWGLAATCRAGGAWLHCPEPLRLAPSAWPQLQKQSELRAPTAERAAFYLDAALAARSTSRPGCSEDARRSSHLFFTLHIYQYRMEKSGKRGSRCPAACPMGPGVQGGGSAGLPHCLPCAFSVWRPQPPAPHRSGQL